MEPNEKINRMHSLIFKINKASEAYYGSGAEIMSNHEWDALYDELQKLEAETGIVMANSPTVVVGAESQAAAGFQKVKHEISVKSLDKTKDIDTLASFIGSRPGIMSWKLDGLTVVLTYDAGELIKAVTRGKNGIGELITDNARNFTGVPSHIPYKGHLNVRGEALITYPDFEEVNAALPEGEEPYKNPRNLAAGSVRQLDPKEVKNRRVRLVTFSSDHDEETHDKEFEWLEAQGFIIVPYIVVKDETQVALAVNTFRGVMEAGRNQCPTDGLVLQFNDTRYGKSLGETDKFPRDAIAFKWQDEEKETTVREIFWSPSRTGLINPVAVFEPVELEGTTVERASVHNVSILEQLSITPGDTITVYKANMIIPQVSDNLTMLDKPVIPDRCPACGGPAQIRIGRDGSKMLYCTNPKCSAKHIKLFVHAVKQDALDMAGISEKTLEDFIGAGLLHTLPDLFRLKDHADKIASMDGYGQKSVDNIMSAIESARTTTLQKLIYACGIDLVGRTAAKTICSHFSYDVIKTLNASKDELTAIPDVGNAIADSYVAWFANPVNQEMFEDLLSEVTLTVPNVKQAMEPTEDKPGIKGKTIVITGDVFIFKNRNEFKEWVETNGGKVTGSVSKKTDFLVTNTPNSGTGKNKDAKELGIPVITEEEIIAMVEDR